MAGEIDYFYTNNHDALLTAQAMERMLNIQAQPLGDPTPYSHTVELEPLNINPSRPFLVFNGSGYFHNSTLGIVHDLVNKRRTAGLPEISYVHIDGHDDIAPPEPGNDRSYKSFVLGIAALNRGGVHILQEGLTGERDSGFIVPAGPETWGGTTDRLRDPHAYLSIDLDVLDIAALEDGTGVHHLFPQESIGFDLPRLLEHIGAIGNLGRLVGADLVGFSREGATNDQITQSLNNIARITRKLTSVLTAK